MSSQISKLYEAEEELSDSLSLLEAIIGSIHNGILVVNPEGAVIRTNAKFAEIWGIPDDILRTRDKFLSIISHDLRGPFSGFLGLTKVIAEDLQNFTMDELQKIASSMEKSAANVFQLLENLLNWAKVQQGLTPFHPRQVKLAEIMNEIVSTILDLAINKKIKIMVDIPDNILVNVDIDMFNTIIRNLVTNALKFTPKSGSVVIGAKYLEENSVVISVKDNGIGMPVEMIEQLFQLDGQTNRYGTENEPSSGLGLLLCKEFTEKQGGKIWVESEEGKGSTFYFTVPVPMENGG